MSDWRPIETAPKDGTWVILGDKERVVMGFWGSYGTWDDGDFHDDLGEFTHWQPLPEPPQ